MSPNGTDKTGTSLALQQPAFGWDRKSLTSPLFDVVSEKQRQVLYQNPYNSIHLSVPQGEDAAERAPTAAGRMEKERYAGTGPAARHIWLLPVLFAAW